MRIHELFIPNIERGILLRQLLTKSQDYLELGVPWPSRLMKKKTLYFEVNHYIVISIFAAHKKVKYHGLTVLLVLILCVLLFV